MEIPAPYDDRTVGTHVAGRIPGMEPGASEGAVAEEKPRNKAEALSVPKGSREVRRPCAEKSRYRSSYARTVNRHRWMRRES